MPKLAKKPVLALGATAMLVFGAAGISAAATSTRLSGTTPDSHRAQGRGPAQDPTALAKALGVSITKLQAAITAARAKDTANDPATDAATQAKTLAAALDSDEATIQKVLDAQRPAGGPKGDRPTGTTPTGTTPPKDRPTGTTPTGTTPPAGGPGRGGPGGHGGGPGGHGGGLLADQSALITALAKATGKSEADVKTALTKIDAARDADREARETEFANNLAAQLGLTEAKVQAAVEASRPARPTRAAQQGTTATK